MNAADRLRRSLSRLPARLGEEVRVDGRLLRGLFQERDPAPGDPLALDFVRAEPRRAATLQLLPADLAGQVVGEAAVIEAIGERWVVVPPLRRDEGGFLMLTLEHSP